MGIVISRISRPRPQKMDPRLEKEIDKRDEEYRTAIKLLLLGPAESGKSTILKQMRLLHDNGFSEVEMQQQKAVVFSNTVHYMATLIQAMNSFNISFRNTGLKLQAETVQQTIQNFFETEPFSDELRIALKTLWADEGVKEAFGKRNLYHLTDSAEYFLDNVDRIGDPTYFPTEEDILRTRVKTTGIVELRFTIRETRMWVFDVGGQRSERKKWIHCFDNVNAIIFISSLSEYDQQLWEDESTNRMVESLRLFDFITNGKWFENTSIILFLNKKDLFIQKLKYTSIHVVFPEYNGPQTYAASTLFIKSQFEALKKNKEKAIYTHLTCATDTNQIQLIITNVLDMIMEQNIGTTGLV